MNCTDYHEHINQFVDGEISAADQTELLRHLAGCDHCQSLIRSIMRLRETMRREQIVYPAELDQVVLGEILPRASTSPISRIPLQPRMHLWNRPIALPAHLAASFAILIVAIGLLVGRLLAPQTERPYYSTTNQPGNIQPQTVVLIYGMPPVEVLGSPTVRTLEGHKQAP